MTHDTQKQIDDGGPAFPRPASEYEPNEMRQDGKISAVPYNGMSLRDLFAGQAMVALITRDADDSAYGSDMIKARPVLAYEYADAMIAARKHKQH